MSRPTPLACPRARMYARATSPPMLCATMSTREAPGVQPGARRPGRALLVRRARGRMAPAVACRPRVSAQVEERARRGDAEHEQHADARERRHAARTAAIARRVKGRTLLFARRRLT